MALCRADIAATGLADGSVDVVCLSLVIHELPPAATRAVCAEAYRILRPDVGQLWITEMDFDTEGFRKLRGNPLLFSFIRATEPYLDEYADYQAAPAAGVPRDLVALGFDRVTLTAATGRHFALVATKPAAGDARAAACTIDDRREQNAKPDTHLRTGEAKL